jgi:hypothetical protein
MLDNILEYNKLCKSKGILFSFCGAVSHDIVVGIGSTLQKKLELENVNSSTSSKVFSVFIEQIQNIIHYSSDRQQVSESKNDTLSFGMVVLGSTDEGYFILCSNKIKKDKVEFLSKKLEKLQGMTKDELKAYYKERRKTKPDNDDSKGAGLGFIEMARSASKPLEFAFKDINSDEDIVFALQITI